MKNFLALMITLVGINASASINWVDYSDHAFSQARKQGKKIVLGFHKKGCATCHAQADVLEATGLDQYEKISFFKLIYGKTEHEKIYKKYKVNKWAVLLMLDEEGNKIPGAKVGAFDTGLKALRKFSDYANVKLRDNILGFKY